MALQHLKVQIIEAKVRPANLPCSSFMPKGRLSQILDSGNVAEALADPAFAVPPHKLNDTVRTVIEEGQQIFAILLEINCEKHLSPFIENEYFNLPLAHEQLLHVIPQNAAVFEKVQRDYHVHSFRRSQYRRNLQDAITLPYLSERRIGSGGFSYVYEVAIHPSHHDFATEEKPTVRGEF